VRVSIEPNRHPGAAMLPTIGAALARFAVQQLLAARRDLSELDLSQMREQVREEEEQEVPMVPPGARVSSNIAENGHSRA
jgi:hypothetical protein